MLPVSMESVPQEGNERAGFQLQLLPLQGTMQTLKFPFFELRISHLL